MTYRSRVVDQELALRLASTGAVVIEGPKACGKTVTGRRMAASEVLLDVDDEARLAVGVDPALVLAGDTPRLIDEWQNEPSIWNHVRRAVDDRGRPGQFILTGSAVPADDVTRHSGAGRLTRLRMGPMSLFETGHATGAIAVRALLDGVPPPQPGDRTHGAASGRVDRGRRLARTPRDRGLTPAEARRANCDYLDEIRRVDVPRVDGARRDPEKIGRLLRSLAQNVATQAGVATMAADAGGTDTPLKTHTAKAYLSALARAS